MYTEHVRKILVRFGPEMNHFLTVGRDLGPGFLTDRRYREQAPLLLALCRITNDNSNRQSARNFGIDA